MQPVRGVIRNEARASVEELPDEKIKTPLQRAIQILKRHRDIRFENDPNGRPSSIIVTTLAAKAYGQQENLFSALIAIATDMDKQIEYDGEGRPVVCNPVNPNENLAEKWQEHPERFTKFQEWLSAVRTDLSELLRVQGLSEISRFLESRFGNRFVKAAVERYGESLGRANEAGLLGQGAGGVSVVGDRRKNPVPRNTFFGS